MTFVNNDREKRTLVREWTENFSGRSVIVPLAVREIWRRL